MQVVILAGGKATRLGALTESRPKSMIMVGDKPFLELQIYALRRAGLQNVLLCLGHLNQQIVDYFGDGHRFGVTITYSIEERPLGTAGALKNAERYLTDKFIAIYGDSYFLLDIEQVVSRFESCGKIGLMTVYRNAGRYDRSNTAIDNHGLVVKYDKQDTAGLQYIDYGLSIFRKSILDLIPHDSYFPLEEVFVKLIEMKELVAFETKERFYEIGSPAGLTEFQKFIEGNQS